MYIQDFIQDIRLSKNNTHLFKNESECNTSARFTFPLIMFFNTSSIHMDEWECNMSARFAFGGLIIFFVWTIPIYIYIHVPKFQTIYTGYLQLWSRHYYYYRCCCCCVVVSIVASCFPLACFLIRLHLSDKNCFLPEKQKLCFLKLYSSFLFQS
jgi:hypothetical protein